MGVRDVAARILQKYPRDSLAEAKLSIEPMGPVRLHMEKNTTTNGKKANSKGHQIIGSSVI